MSADGNSAGDISGGYVVQVRNVHGNVVTGQGGREPVPRQLGRATPLFTDRDEARRRMEEYRRACRERGIPLILVLQGVRGVGKTELALHYLEEIAGEYTGPHLQISLDDAAIHLSPDVLLDRVLHDLGVDPAAVPADTAGKRAALRTRMADRSTIILLDGVTDITQVTELIPTSSNAVVVVTSARQLPALHLERAEFLTVEPMNDDAIAEYFRRALPGDRWEEVCAEGLDRFVACCQGMPGRAAHVVLRLVGNSFECADELLEELEASGADAYTEVEDAIRRLDPPTARLLMLAGLHFGAESDRGALASVFDGGDLKESLKRLGEHALAEPASRSRRRVRLGHAAARVAARLAPAELGEGEAFRVMLRYADHYRESAIRASEAMSRRWMVSEHGDATGLDLPRLRTSREARDWLRDNMDTLLAVARWCHDAHQYATVWKLAEATDAFLRENGRYTERLEFLDLGVRAAAACGHRKAEARLRNQRGLTFLDLRRAADADAEFERALRLSEEDGDARGQGAALEARGLAAQNRGGHDAALDFFDRARPYKATTGAAHDAAVLDLLSGRSLIALGRFEEAVARLDPALAEFRAASGQRTEPDLGNAAKVLLERGRALAGLGRIEEAREQLEEAVFLFGEKGNRFQEARVLEAMAGVARAAGETGWSEHLGQAVELYRAIGNEPEALRVGGLLP